MSVQLSRGDRLKLEKPGGGRLTHIELAFDAQAWNGAGVSKVQPVCVLLDGCKNVIDAVYAGRDSKDGSVRCVDGKITVNLAAVPSSVQYVAAAVFGPDKLGAVTTRFTDIAGADLCYATEDATSKPAVVVARLFRYNADWKLEPLAFPSEADAPLALVPAIKASW